MTTPVRDRGPVHAKMAAQQAEDCIAVLAEIIRECSAVAARRESIPDWIAALPIEKLLDYNSAIGILGMVVPYMRMAMLLHPPEDVKAGAAALKAREDAARAAMVQSGGHDAL